MKPQAKAPAKAKKPAAKAKAPAKKAPAKKAPVKKAPAKKVPAKKVPAKKAPAKKTASKAPAKKPVAKQPVAKKAVPVKAAPKPVAKKAPAAKAAQQKPIQAPVAAPARAASSNKPPAHAASPAASAAAQAATVPAAAKASYTPTMSTMLKPPPLVAIKKDPKLANNWKSKSAEDLSDEEILAMPDSEYMNDKQMAFFRHKLVQLKLDIHNSAGETTEHLREDTVVVPDPADRATIEEEHALELRTRDRERKLLKKIEQSIARIDSGDYGYCDETGEPIGVGRLLARPTATLSLEAQQRRELKQKMFGD